MDYYIINLSHTQRADRYISVWRPECKGYAWPLCWAGRYSEEEVRAQLDYYNSGDNIAVPCSVVDPLGVATVPGTVDGDAGPVVLNNADNWKTLLANVIAPPAYKPKPKYNRKSVARAA